MTVFRPPRYLGVLLICVLLLAGLPLCASPGVTLQISHLAAHEAEEAKVLADLSIRLEEEAGDSGIPIRLDADLQIRGPLAGPPESRSAARLLLELGALRLYRAPLEAGALLGFLDNPVGPGLAPSTLDPPTGPGPGDCSWNPRRPSFGLGLNVPGLSADSVGWRSPESGDHLALLVERGGRFVVFAVGLHAGELPPDKPDDEWFPAAPDAGGTVLHVGSILLARPGNLRLRLSAAQMLRPWSAQTLGAEPLVGAGALRFNLAMTPQRFLLGAGIGAAHPEWRGLDGKPDSGWLAGAVRARIGPEEGPAASARFSAELQHPPNPPRGYYPGVRDLELRLFSDSRRAVHAGLEFARAVENGGDAAPPEHQTGLTLELQTPETPQRRLQFSASAEGWLHWEAVQDPGPSGGTAAESQADVPSWTSSGGQLSLTGEWGPGADNSVELVAGVELLPDPELPQPHVGRRLGLELAGPRFSVSVERTTDTIESRLTLRY